MNDLLDANIEDLADLPEFAVLPDGHLKGIIKWEQKEVNSKPAIELKVTVTEVIELSDPTAEVPDSGLEGNVLFMLDNEYGQGKLKAILKPLAAVAGGGSMREVMEASQGMEIEFISKHSTKKNDPSVKYSGITKIIA